jgi:acyl-coenzyme A thioesterase PaaI-like protein
VSERFDGSLFGDEPPCFGCSPRNPHGLRLSFWREGDTARTRFTPDRLQQGPPGIMHGGLVTTVADELAGWTLVLLREKFGFTAEIHARLVGPVRIGAEVEGRGRIVRDGRRVVRIAVELEQAGAVAFESELAFVLLDRGGAEKLLGAPIPEGWRRWCR